MREKISAGTIARGILFIVACALLYYGGVMLLLVPGAPHEGYFERNRVFYGVVPFLVSVFLLVVVGLLSAGSSDRSGSAGGSVVSTFSYAITAVVLFHIGIMVLAGLLRK